MPGTIRLFQKGGILSECYQLLPVSADDWFNKVLPMYYHVYVIMHVKDLQLSVVRVGHRVPLPGLCLSLYGLNVMNRDVNAIQTNKKATLRLFFCRKKPTSGTQCPAVITNRYFTSFVIQTP